MYDVVRRLSHAIADTSSARDRPGNESFTGGSRSKSVVLCKMWQNAGELHPKLLIRSERVVRVQSNRSVRFYKDRVAGVKKLS